MHDFESDISNSINTINKGGIILYPTDTVWGLGCDATNEAAVSKIFDLKQRPREKSLVILLADARDILQYIAAPLPDIIAIVESFNTPTTVIYHGALGIAENAISENGTVAIRVTTDPFCKALIKRMQKPLVSTSANLSGQPTPAIFAAVDAAIVNGVDYAVQYRRSDDTPRTPSRIVRIGNDGEIEIIRP
jgi:L-threonylcarbamoyladenylate synthase